jgi:hypothetical protein
MRTSQIHHRHRLQPPRKSFATTHIRRKMTADEESYENLPVK